METTHEQLERLLTGGIMLSDEQSLAYLEAADELGEVVKGDNVPPGYKRCGRCGIGKKFYLFNKNGGSKTNTSGNCKACQKKSAANSYKQTKKRRNYKKYYQENKELKQAHARQYYANNKDVINAKHKEYLQTKAGKKVMQRAHTKRRIALATNKGVPYTREMIIERDGVFIGEEHPVCYLCGKHILSSAGSELHIDHVIPVVGGGLDCITNVASTHKLCNLEREKDARLLTTDQVELIKERGMAYMDAYPEKFE